MTIQKPDFNQIFASQAPDADKPPVFNNYNGGWGDESRPNNGKPTIKGFNYLQQFTDSKLLWLKQNAILPYDSDTDYPVGTVTLKDGKFQKWDGSNWVDFIKVDDSQITTWSGRTQESKNKDVINAKDVGLVPNDSNFDNASVFESLATLYPNQTLFLEPSALYYVSRPVVYTGNLFMETQGKSATIKNKTSGQMCFNVIGSSIGTANVVGGVTIFSRSVVVDNISNIQAGDLIGLVSSAFWYCDARGETYKSQLNKVDRVEGNMVYVCTAWSESFDSPAETLKIEIYRPIKSIIKNVNFECTSVAVTPTNTPNARALVLSYTVDSVLENVNTINGQGCGIQIGRSYNTQVIGGVSDGSNAYTSGYGVQTDGSTHTLVQNRTILRGRRGVDVSGIGIISTHTTVKGCTVIGGGVNSRGTVYGWNSDGTTGAYQGGVGTHGAANFTVIEDNYIVNVHQPVILRSINNIVKGNTIVGRTVNGAINAAFGGNNLIYDNSVIMGLVSNLGQSPNVYDGQSNINSRRAECFFTIQGTCIGEQIVRNNYAEVQANFIEALGDTLNSNILQVYDNNIIHRTPLGTTECYLVSSNTVSAATQSGSRFYNNAQRRVGGSGTINILPSIIVLNASLMYGKAEGVLSGSYPTPVVSSSTNTSTAYCGGLQAVRIGNLINASLVVVLTPSSVGECTVNFPVPYVGTFSSNGWCIGTAVAEDASTFGVVQSVTSSNNVVLRLKALNTTTLRMQLNFQYQARN